MPRKFNEIRDLYRLVTISLIYLIPALSFEYIVLRLTQFASFNCYSLGQRVCSETSSINSRLAGELNSQLIFT